jgi:LacI family transcriptional regulator
MPLQKRVTIEMIAKKAGLSKMSVSRCLRGHPNNSPETHARVQKIAREMGYRPNPMVASLMADIRSRKAQDYSTVIGVLDDFEGSRPPLYESSWTEHLNGMREEADELGYKLEVFRYREQQWNERTLSRVLWARNVRGLIVPYQVRIIDFLRLDLSNCACVSLGYTLSKPNLHRVCPDFSDAMQLALDQVAAAGYQRPAFVTTKNNNLRTKQLFLGSYLSAQQVAMAKPQVLELRGNEEDLAKAVIPWLKKHRPDCIISPFYPIIDILKHAGYRLGHDLGYVQLNWTSLAEGIAGVRNRNQLQGRLAVKLINASILSNDYGVPEEAFVHLVKNIWVPGDSIVSRKNGD